MGDVVKFNKGAGLPTSGIGGYKQALLKTKDAVGISGNNPFLRLVKGNGYWVYGAKNIEVEENSLWAINPTSIMTGFVAWRGGRPVGQKMRPLGKLVTRDELPDVGVEWDDCVAFTLQCVYGEDEGTVVEYTANSYGGRKAFSELLSDLYKQAESDEVNIVPVVELLSESYVHPEWGTTYNPIFKIRKWVGLQGEEVPAEPPPPVKEPERAAEKPPEAARVAPSNGAAPPRRRAAAPLTDVTEQPTEPPKTPPGAPADPVQRRRRRAAAS